MNLRNLQKVGTLLFALTLTGSLTSGPALGAEFSSFSEPSSTSQAAERIHMIPVLGTIWNANSEKVGIVTDLQVSLKVRDDHGGLRVVFATPDNFSADSRADLRTAILRAAHAANMEAGAWTVIIETPHPEVTIAGPSYSAMTALTVIALAKGDTVYADRVMTGTVMEDGAIGQVGGVDLKVAAAFTSGLRHILVPETFRGSVQMPETPFLLAVSSVASLADAYTALTDQSIL